ncbi:hypothetical protein [Georgenia sp. AZ-5]|uniref:hypothetical protein n=1 Tax=Georgenia sp. AZ-5 TaxID=3367526 RepID=UPI0037540107
MTLDFTQQLARQRAQDARQRLAAAQQRATQINLELRNQLDEARRYQDPDLTAEGLRKRQEQMAATARDVASRKLAELKQDVETATAQVRSWADPLRPKVGDDAASLMRLQFAWDRARMLLESGRTVPEVLVNADADVALAVREWGPDWVRAQTPRAQGMARTLQEEPDTSGLVRSAEARLAEVLGGQSAAAIEALRDVDVVQASLVPTVAFIDRQVSGVPADNRALMSAALESRFAAQEAVRGFQQPAATDVQDHAASAAGQER